MCGIAGVFEYGRTRGGVSPELIIRMRDTMEHRGPDGAGMFLSEDRRLGLGHRRLAIVDLAGGAQPMAAEAGVMIVFNGEIYNYPKLRTDFEKTGMRFKTRCDTEVILHLYLRYGEECVEHLNGMFAFAVWDPRDESLFFARDPIGEKPFYWSDRGGVFAFASEIKALLQHPEIHPAVNTAALGPYLTNLVTPAPETMFEGIFKLRPGEAGRCDASGMRSWRYFQASVLRSLEPSTRQETADVRCLLEDAVRSRLMSDVPVGVLLSGGMDSSTIVALLAEQAAELSSFTVGFPGDRGADEREEARFVADRFGTEHHEVTLTETAAMSILPSLIHHQDEPLADPVCVPLHAVCALAQSCGIKVVLAGEGADELFWGYNEFAYTVGNWRRFAAVLALPRQVRRVAARLTSATKHPRRRDSLEALASGRMNPIHMPLGLPGPYRRMILGLQENGSAWRPSEPRSSETALTRMAFDTQEYEFDVRLPELLLMRIDRFSMANSVEARVPFLDPDLVRYVYRLPVELKVRNGSGKWILKHAVSDVVPERVAQRRKQGFAAPTWRWFVGRHGTLLKHLADQESVRRYFNPQGVRQLIERTATSWEAGQVLWPLLNFALWHKYWIEDEPLHDLIEDHSEAVAQ